MNLIFCDESGDAGFKFGKGSSDFLNFTFVNFSNLNEAEKCASFVRNFKKNDDEIHFVKESPKTREKFFKNCKPFDFTVLNFIIDKRKITKPENDFIIYAFDYFKSELANSTVYIDGKSTKQNRQNLETTINKTFKNATLKGVNIKFANSKNDVLVQLADMFAGLCHKNLEHPNKFYAELQKEFKNRIKQNIPEGIFAN